MCLILFAYKAHPRYRLVLGANRDEFYARPTAPLDFWPDHPDVLAGRDLEHNGTWMGVTRNGRLAAITNYRDPRIVRTAAPSRGHLVSDFLVGRLTPQEYLRQVAETADRYNGFNLIVGDSTELAYFSNQEMAIRILQPGIYGLSNHLLDSHWPKVVAGKRLLKMHLENGEDIQAEGILELLQDQSPADDHDLPATGVGLALERILSPVFITSPDYGTRCSSVLTIDAGCRLRFCERTWVAARPKPQEAFTRSFEFDTSNASTDAPRIYSRSFCR